MFSHLAIRRAIDATKLGNYSKKKFVRPPRPVGSARYISLRHKPTVFVRDPNWFNAVLSFQPGHVDFDFSPADIQLAKTFDPAPRSFATVMASLGLSDKLTMGHAPNTTPTSLQRTYRTLGSMGVEYHNIEYKAQPWYVEYNAMKDKDIKSANLGNLRPMHMARLTDIADDQLRRNYSLGGTDKPPPDKLWTLDEFTRFFTDNIFPLGAENCCDFIARCLETLARCEAPDSPALHTFQYQLGFARQPQDLVELAVAYFKPGADGFLSFAAPPPKPQTPPAPGRELTQEEEMWTEMQEDSAAAEAKAAKDKLAAFRKSVNYTPFAKAFGGKPEVFDAIAVAMHNDNSIFDSIFASSADLAWGTTFFKGLGERLAVCEGTQGIAAVLYHKDTYPGGIAHTSEIGFSPAGKMTILHHESMLIGEKPAMVDGLALGTLGIPACSYNTIDLHNRAQNRTGDKVLKWAELPVVKSYIASGPPMVTFTPLDSFNGFDGFTHMVVAQGQGALGRQWLYSVDPNLTLAQIAAGVKAGKIHLTPTQLALLRADHVLAAHPKVPPPGATGTFTWGLTPNNCARMNLLGLKAGRAPALRGVHYSEEMDLADVASALLGAGLMPNTDPAVVDRMRRAGHVYNKVKQRVERHPASFLALGQLSGWSNAAPGTHGTYPPDVDRRPPKDPAAEAKARQEGDARLAETIKKNEQSFIDALTHKPAPPPAAAWVVRELSEKDRALMDAHVAGLSEEDLALRFGNRRMTEMPRLPNQAFGVFDATGQHMAALGVMAFYLSSGGVPTLQTGLSVLPAFRKKGLGKLAMQWAWCVARNRGVRLHIARYRHDNAASMGLLASLGTYVDIGWGRSGWVETETALPELDGDSLLFEAMHRKLSAAWSHK